MRIILGYDGSPCADDAIADLARAGLPADTQALVLCAVDIFLPGSAWDAQEPLPEVAGVIEAQVRQARKAAENAIQAARESGERAAERIRRQFPQWTVQVEARADTPHWALVGMADEWKADLIVVGSHGRSALGRLLLGSVSQTVLHNAPCSVRIARSLVDGERPREQRVRLVLGIDGSVDSATAVSAVSARSWPSRTEVHVVGVLDSHLVMSHLQVQTADERVPDVASISPSADLQESLTRVREELRRSGLAATTSLLIGDPKKILQQEAKRLDADCIFVGAKGHGRLDRLLIGSVSAAIAARASCSVEVVRAGDYH